MVENPVLEARRRRLLEAIGQTDLNVIYARVTGSPTAASYQFLRRAILSEWDAYADEMRHWVEFTLTGESVL
jgi:hypothetical protein